MSALSGGLADFLDGQRVGVLATQGPDGRPRQSVVYYARDGDRLLISTGPTAGRGSPWSITPGTETAC